MRRSLILLLSAIFVILLLVGCQSAPPPEENAVLSVIPDGKGSLTLEAVLTPDFLESYAEKNVFVFELPSSAGGEVDLTYATPIAEAKAKEEVEVSFADADGPRSRLYSSFVLAAHDKATDSYRPITAPLSVTDLTKLATAGEAAPKAERSIKGLIASEPADALRLGISHTVLEVPLETLILSGWQEGAVPYVWNGKTAYVRGEALEALDTAVATYGAAGVRIYLRFTLGAPADTTPLCLYVATERTDAVADYAINMESEEAAEILEGFFDFMADRYASPDEGAPYEGTAVTAFLMGRRVNGAAARATGDGSSLSAYIHNYEKLIRLAHTAIKSHNKDGRVYVALDDRRTLSEGDGGWDVATFLSAFAEESAKRGAYDWYPACELYAPRDTVWVEDPAVDATHYTVHSLSTLTDLLSGEKYVTATGEARRLLISGFSIPSDQSGTRQAASYAYTYALCAKNGRVEALIYDVYADTADDGRGLWTVTSKGELDRRRPIHELLGTVDTTAGATLPDKLSAEIGSEDFTRVLQELLSTTPPVASVTGEATVGRLDREDSAHTKSDVLFTFDTGSLRGFRGVGDPRYLELREAETLHTISLYAAFGPAEGYDPSGVTVTIPASELMGHTSLILDLYAGIDAPDASAERPTLTLRLTRPATGSPASGEGTVIYEASAARIKDGVWQSAKFEINTFTAKLDDDDTVTLTLLLEYGDEPVGESHLNLLGMYAAGGLSAGGSAATVVIVVVAVIAVLGAAAAAFLLSGKKKR